MKTIQRYIAVLLIAPAFVACNQKKVDQLTSENQELSSEKQELSTELEDYMKTFNEIEANLKEIKSREDKINLSTSDNVEYKEDDAKKAVVNDIKAINTLMAENRAKMSELQTKLNTNSSEFKKMVANLNYRIKQKDNEIATMKGDLEKLNIEKEQLTENVEHLTYTVDTLSNANSEKTEVIANQTKTIEEQTESLNTGYVAIGTKKDLEEEEVITKEGGVLGLGATEKLKADMNNKAFSKIDISKTNSIPVFAKKLELVTSHPTDSYELAWNDQDQIEKLVILNPAKFWNSSKYLVVKVN
ncbi:Cbp1 family collagen-binding glycoprotein adhesin [Fulvivirga sediminis]|uniref:Autophagy-related protein 16 domain-containing protein n=1 Tax=Fulvivirga sediminis TaxID=2803949 RepID=A0A937K0R5_9BACT|nr:hypothetical protein [Fulvivirga sediminis]MBL3656636.1 hypothetical protein [Fulvivirga sediminis]